MLLGISGDGQSKQVDGIVIVHELGAKILAVGTIFAE